MTPAQRARLLLKLADLIEANGDEIALLETLDNGMPFRMAKFGGVIRRGREPALPRRLGHEDPRRHDQPQHAGRVACVHAARAGRRRRPDRAVELSVRDGRGQDRAGAGRGLHRGAQARGTDAADHAAAGRADRRGGISRRRGQHRHRVRRDRGARAGGALRTSTRSPSPARPAWARRSSKACAGQSQARDAGARRQIAGDHLSGRGARARHRSRGARHLHELRPGVRRRLAAVRARESVRPGGRGRGRAREEAESRARAPKPPRRSVPWSPKCSASA